MHLLEQLQFDLVVFHPYYDIDRYVRNADPNLLAGAWQLLNQAQRTDCILVYPSCVIAFAALYLSSVHSGIDLKSWFEELNLNLDQVRSCALDILGEPSVADNGLKQTLREVTVFWKGQRPG